jgi:ParB/RepB/Spo0J family partition protein
MPRKPRYDAVAAATRARVPDAARATRVTQSRKTAAPVGEFREISVHQITPAPWQPRVVFEHIEELIASIEGTADTPGVGVLEPILARAVADGRYELIDGERRWRAAQEVARRSPTGDFLIPTRVLDVTPGIAQVMGLIANMHRDSPKPIEIALACARIRDILREELGPEAGSARAIAGYGRLKKTPVAEYLRIADAITPILAAATDSADAPDYSVVGAWTKGQLLEIVDVKDPLARAAALRSRLDGSIRDAKPQRAEDAVLCPGDRRRAIAAHTPFAIKLRLPAEMMRPEDAQAVAVNELSPAMLAMVDRGLGGAARPGFLLDTSDAHFVLVVPNEVEALTLQQAQLLLREMATLRKRLTRACRMRTDSSRSAKPTAEAA